MENITSVKLCMKGGAATPAPPVGTQLGSKGINTRKFCEQFNAQTQDIKGKLVRVEVLVAPDRTFEIKIKNTPSVELIKQFTKEKIAKGSAEPNRNKVGTLTLEDVHKIIAQLGDELRAFTPEAKINTIKGTARSMGVTIN